MHIGSIMIWLLPKFSDLFLILFFPLSYTLLPTTNRFFVIIINILTFIEHLFFSYSIHYFTCAILYDFQINFQIKEGNYFYSVHFIKEVHRLVSWR